VIQSAEGLVEATDNRASIKPSDLFWQMFESGQQIFDGSKGISGKIAGTIVWLLLCVLGAVVVGLMIVTYIEIYVVFTVGILALGFGVWEVTAQFAKNFLFSAVGKIFKLFTMILMASVISLTIQAFGTLSSFEDGLITIGIVLIFAMLMTSVPQAVEQIISGIPAISGDAAVSSAITGASIKGAKIAGNATASAAKSALSAGGKLAGSGAKKAGTALASRIRDIKKG
jgi:type IV secretory pathway TrbL component